MYAKMESSAQKDKHSYKIASYRAQKLELGGRSVGRQRDYRIRPFILLSLSSMPRYRLGKCKSLNKILET